jgi:hypothetical protein
MPPLPGLDTVLEPPPFPSRHAGPWAKGCRPPRRASNDAEVLKLALMGRRPGKRSGLPGPTLQESQKGRSQKSESRTSCPLLIALVLLTDKKPQSLGKRDSATGLDGQDLGPIDRPRDDSGDAGDN